MENKYKNGLVATMVAAALLGSGCTTRGGSTQPPVTTANNSSSYTPLVLEATNPLRKKITDFGEIPGFESARYKDLTIRRTGSGIIAERECDNLVVLADGSVMYKSGDIMYKVGKSTTAPSDLVTVLDGKQGGNLTDDTVLTFDLKGYHFAKVEPIEVEKSTRNLAQRLATLISADTPSIDFIDGTGGIFIDNQIYARTDGTSQIYNRVIGGRESLASSWAGKTVEFEFEKDRHFVMVDGKPVEVELDNGSERFFLKDSIYPGVAAISYDSKGQKVQVSREIENAREAYDLAITAKRDGDHSDNSDRYDLERVTEWTTDNKPKIVILDDVEDGSGFAHYEFDVRNCTFTGKRRTTEGKELIPIQDTTAFWCPIERIIYSTDGKVIRRGN
jgi:hypothetical protein